MGIKQLREPARFLGLWGGETFVMKPLLKKIIRFLQKEWFLFVMLAAIALIVLLFQMLK